MACGRTCSLWKLDVLAIALTPSSIASKPSACQSRQRVRSDPKCQKPPFAHRMYFFFAEACRLGSVKLFFTEPCSRRDRFVFFFVFICFAISILHRLHPETTHSVSKLTHNTPRFSNSPSVGRRPYRHRTQLRTPVFRALSSGLNFRAAGRLRSVSSSLRGLNDACAGRRLVDLCF